MFDDPMPEFAASPTRLAHPSGPSWVREPDGDRLIEQNWLFLLRQERARSRATGTSRDYFVLHLRDSVNVIAITPYREVVLVEQYRAGSARDSLETPGGLIDPGEDPLEAAVRELREETGYIGDPPRVLGTVWANPSILTARSTTVVVTNAVKLHDPKPDEGEEVTVRLVPAHRVPRMIRNGQVGHALAVAGLLWWLASEIPDTPLELPPLERRRGQFRIGALMIGIAVFAVFAALLRQALMEHSFPLIAVLLLVTIPALALFIQKRWIDPPDHAILLRERRFAPGRAFGVFLVWFGLTNFLLIGAAVALNLVGPLLAP